MMKRLLLPLILVGLFLIPTGVVLAAPLDTVVGESETVNNDIAVFGEDLILEAGSTVNGDVLVFGGNARIDGQINGDLAVFGGNTTVSSRIDGDIVLFGGNLEAESGSSVKGDCVLLGGNFNKRGDSGLGCTSAGEVGFSIPDGVWFGDFGDVEPFARSFAGDVAGLLGGTAFAALLALVIASAAPQQMGEIQRTIRSQPAASGAVGLLTAVAVPAIIALLVPISILLLFVCVGILGFPIMLALGVGLIAGSVLGWVTVGQMIGQRVAEMLKWQKLSPVTTAVLGTVVITFGLGLLGLLSLGFFEGLIRLALASIGLGAVALTQFGRKPYPYVTAPAEPTVELAETIEDEINIMVDEDKLTAVLDTLPDEDDMPLN